MKSIPLILVFGLLLGADISFAVVPVSRDSSEIALPGDTLSTTMRGAMTICNRPGSSGRKGLKFMQLDKSACPVEPQKAVGWDRPQMEPVPPGIPFQDQGIERF